MNAYGLSDAVIEHLRTTFARFPLVEKAVIYGSRGRGDFRPESDIDLAIYAPDMDDRAFAALWNALDDLPIVFKMDVLHADRLENPSLKAAIERDGKALYERSP